MSENQLVSLKDVKRLCAAYQTKIESESSSINSISYHYNGEVLVFNSSDQVFVLGLSNEGLTEMHYTMRKYGAGLCRFIDEVHIVHTSKKSDDNLRLLSLESKNYVRYFAGHSKEVTSVSVQDISIASGSKDSSVHLWDARLQKSTNRKEFHSPPLVAFHPFGKFIAVSSRHAQVVEVFDRSYFTFASETINHFKYERDEGVEWTGLKFSDDGIMLLVTTNSTSILVINVTTGHELHNFRDYSNSKNENIDACFSAGSNFVIGGSSNGFIHFWDCKTSLKVHSIESCCGGESSCVNVAFNPKFMNFASSNGNVIQLWNEDF
jgi:COMPASS component SWD2